MKNFFLIIIYIHFLVQTFLIFFSFDTISLNNLDISNNIICPDISPTTICFKPWNNDHNSKIFFLTILYMFEFIFLYFHL